MPSLPQDKANHAIYGALIFLLALTILRRPDAAYGLVVAAAVGKEVLDWLSNQRAIRGRPNTRAWRRMVRCPGNLRWRGGAAPC